MRRPWKETCHKCGTAIKPGQLFERRRNKPVCMACIRAAKKNA